MNVVVKGTTSGTISDFNGNYELTAGPNDVLIFSYIGYKELEMPVGNQTEISVDLEEDAAQLDEVVVVGYSTQKKKRLDRSHWPG